MKSPPRFMLARSVRRMSIDAAARIAAQAGACAPRRAAARAASSPALAARSPAGHLREVFLCSTSRSDTVMRVSISISRSCLSLSSSAGEQRLLRCASRRPAAAAARSAAPRQHHRHELVEIAALAEEDPEGLVEQHRMLVPLHEHRVQRPVEVLAVADAGGLSRPRARRAPRRARPECRRRAARARNTGCSRRAGRADLAGALRAGAPLLRRPQFRASPRRSAP